MTPSSPAPALLATLFTFLKSVSIIGYKVTERGSAHCNTKHSMTAAEPN